MNVLVTIHECVEAILKSQSTRVSSNFKLSFKSVDKINNLIDDILLCFSHPNPRIVWALNVGWGILRSTPLFDLCLTLFGTLTSRDLGVMLNMGVLIQHSPLFSLPHS